MAVGNSDETLRLVLESLIGSDWRALLSGNLLSRRVKNVSFSLLDVLSNHLVTSSRSLD